MPTFSLEISAKRNGETVLKSYNWESADTYSEAFIIQSYQEFHPELSDISIVSLTSSAKESKGQFSDLVN